MERRLNLIKTDYEELEKRIFPRFPYTYLTFKGDDQVFEVKDITYTGMQLCRKDGGHSHIPGDIIGGTLHWRGQELDIKGKVMWAKGARLGVAFDKDGGFPQSVEKFLCVENIIAGMRALHKIDLDLEIPANLKYWLRSDGPVELFVWCHNDGELSRFQVIVRENFLEWEDGKGVKTGRVLTQRDLDTPLSPEDEFVFTMDHSSCPYKVELASSVIEAIPEELLTSEAQHFLLRKLGN